MSWLYESTIRYEAKYKERKVCQQERGLKIYTNWLWIF